MKIKKILSCATLCMLPMSGGFAQDTSDASLITESEADGVSGLVDEKRYEFCDVVSKKVYEETLEAENQADANPYVVWFLNADLTDTDIDLDYTIKRGKAFNTHSKSVVDVIKGRLNLKKTIEDYIELNGWKGVYYAEHVQDVFTGGKTKCGKIIVLSKAWLLKNAISFKSGMGDLDKRVYQYFVPDEYQKPICFEYCFDANLEDCKFALDSETPGKS